MKKLIVISTDLVSSNEDLAGVYSLTAVPVRAPYYQSIDLDELIPPAKAVAPYETAITLGSWMNRIDISSPSEPLTLYDTLEVSDYSNDYVVSAKAPSLQWFDERRDDIENPDPTKVYFPDTWLAVRFEPYMHNEESTFVYVVDLHPVSDFLTDTEGYSMPWIEGVQSLDDYAEQFGYTVDDEGKLDAVETALVTYYMAKMQKFPDPKEVVAHFCGKELTAELTLKGAFEGVQGF